MEHTEQQQQHQDAGDAETTEAAVFKDEGAKDSNFLVETDGDSYE